MSVSDALVGQGLVLLIPAVVAAIIAAVAGDQGEKRRQRFYGVMGWTLLVGALGSFLGSIWSQVVA